MVGTEDHIGAIDSEVTGIVSNVIISEAQTDMRMTFACKQSLTLEQMVFFQAYLTIKTDFYDMNLS